MPHEALTDMQRYAAMVPDITEQLARYHTDPEESKLVLLDNNVSKYAGQDPFCYRYVGNPQPTPLVDGVAEFTEPRFPAMMEELRGDQQVLTVIHETKGHLQDKKSVWVITPHGDILDIAYIYKGVVNLLEDQDYQARRRMAIFSKTLSRVGLAMHPDQEPLDTVGTMGVLCDDIFLTWQRTKSAQKIINKLPKGEVRRHNESATQEMDDELTEGDALAAMAPTATTRMKTNRAGALILPRPGKGTMGLLVKANTLVLPVPAWFKGEKIMVAMPSSPMEISEESQVHEMLKFMTEVMTERIEGLNFVYDMPRRRIGQVIMGAFSSSRPEAKAA